MDKHLLTDILQDIQMGVIAAENIDHIDRLYAKAKNSIEESIKWVENRLNGKTWATIIREVCENYIITNKENIIHPEQ